MTRESRRNVITSADGRELTRAQRLASSLVQHPYTRSSLVRAVALNAAGVVLWALGAAIVGSVGLTGVLILGAAFFGMRAVANVVVIGMLPDDDDSKRSGNVESS